MILLHVYPHKVMYILFSNFIKFINFCIQILLDLKTKIFDLMTISVQLPSKVDRESMNMY